MLERVPKIFIIVDYMIKNLFFFLFGLEFLLELSAQRRFKIFFLLTTKIQLSSGHPDWVLKNNTLKELFNITGVFLCQFCTIRFIFLFLFFNQIQILLCWVDSLQGYCTPTFGSENERESVCVREREREQRLAYTSHACTHAPPKAATHIQSMFITSSLACFLLNTFTNFFN